MSHKMQDVFNFASDLFSPTNLLRFIKREDGGVVTVDEEGMCSTVEERKLWWVAMSANFGWDFSSPEASTVYLEAVDGLIYGGIFDRALKKKMTRRVLAAGSQAIKAPYIYKQADMEKMMNILRNA